MKTYPSSNWRRLRFERCRIYRTRQKLVVLGIRKSYKRQMISRKSFWSWKVLIGSLVFHIIKITRIIITREFANNWRNTVTNIFEVPLIIFEKGVRLDFFNTLVTKTISSAKQNVTLLINPWIKLRHQDLINNVFVSMFGHRAYPWEVVLPISKTSFMTNFSVKSTVTYRSVRKARMIFSACLLICTSSGNSKAFLWSMILP